MDEADILADRKAVITKVGYQRYFMLEFKFKIWTVSFLTNPFSIFKSKIWTILFFRKLIKIQ